jgi:hypothetical protein
MRHCAKFGCRPALVLGLLTILLCDSSGEHASQSDGLEHFGEVLGRALDRDANRSRVASLVTGRWNQIAPWLAAVDELTRAA